MFQVLMDPHRRFAVVVDENPRYTRLLTNEGRGVDIIKVLPYQLKRWAPFEMLNHRAALRYAITWIRSTTSKTQRAARALEEVMSKELHEMSMPELVAEFNRLTGKETKRFATKTAAINAIKKAVGATKNVNEPASTQPEPSNTTEETSMPAKTKTAKTKATKTKIAKTKPAKISKPRGKPAQDAIEKAKRICASDKGSGGYIRQLLLAGEDDTEKILSKVLKKFPDRNTKASD